MKDNIPVRLVPKIFYDQYNKAKHVDQKTMKNSLTSFPIVQSKIINTFKLTQQLEEIESEAILPIQNNDQSELFILATCLTYYNDKNSVFYKNINAIEVINLANNCDSLGIKISSKKFIARLLAIANQDSNVVKKHLTPNVQNILTQKLIAQNKYDVKILKPYCNKLDNTVHLYRHGGSSRLFNLVTKQKRKICYFNKKTKQTIIYTKTGDFITSITVYKHKSLIEKLFASTISDEEIDLTEHRIKTIDQAKYNADETVLIITGKALVNKDEQQYSYIIDFNKGQVSFIKNIHCSFDEYNLRNLYASNNALLFSYNLDTKEKTEICSFSKQITHITTSKNMIAVATANKSTDNGFNVHIKSNEQSPWKRIFIERAGIKDTHIHSITLSHDTNMLCVFLNRTESECQNQIYLYDTDSCQLIANIPLGDAFTHKSSSRTNKISPAFTSDDSFLIIPTTGPKAYIYTIATGNFFEKAIDNKIIGCYGEYLLTESYAMPNRRKTPVKNIRSVKLIDKPMKLFAQSIKEQKTNSKKIPFSFACLAFQKPGYLYNSIAQDDAKIINDNPLLKKILNFSYFNIVGNKWYNHIQGLTKGICHAAINNTTTQQKCLTLLYCILAILVLCNKRQYAALISGSAFIFFMPVNIIHTISMIMMTII